MKEICSLKRTIGKKITMEHPDYVSNSDPSEDVQLWCTECTLKEQSKHWKKSEEHTPDKGRVKIHSI